MALKIGSKPISCDGDEALAAIANGLRKAANLPVDPKSVTVKIRSADGEVTELRSDGSLEISASVAVPVKKEKPPKAAK